MAMVSSVAASGYDMGCHYPVGLVDNAGDYVYRPCGTCMGCRLEYQRGWAVRCVHEAMMHNDNAYLTLTYNNENLPEDKSVHKKEIQNFMKRLRNGITEKVRYFACGEYGDNLNRPHYHMLLFGYMPNDLVLYKHGNSRVFKNRFHTGEDFSLYTSQFVQNVWKKGFVWVGNVQYESAAYVARYCTKKINGDKAKSHYKGKNPEFALMSRGTKDGGGIGYSWINKYMSDVYPKDFVTMRGKKFRPMRYYDEAYKKSHPIGYEAVKKKRKEFNKRYAENPAIDGMRGYNLDAYTKAKTKNLKRNYENDK